VYLHLDHLGSARVITGASGNVVSTHHYMPFGEEMPSVTQGATNKRQFTGHERDPESGMDYMLARYYGSALGRFDSPDPGSDIRSEEPQSWNLYTYVRNNPILLVDPDGRRIKIDPDTGDKKKDKQIKKQIKKDLKKAAKADPSLKAMIKALKQSSNTFVITTPGQGKWNWYRPASGDDASNGTGSGGRVFYDPSNSQTSSGDQRNPVDGLVHELGHAYESDLGSINYGTDPATNNQVIYSEYQGVRTENLVRPAMGDSPRTTYGGYPVPNYLEHPFPWLQ
jgi:RHS repeat-associated protein